MYSFIFHQNILIYFYYNFVGIILCEYIDLEDQVCLHSIIN